MVAKCAAWSYSAVMIERTIAPVLRRLASSYPVVTLTGPRQSGKTTLCRTVFPDLPYINLEAPDQRALAIEDPRGFLASVPEGAIFDEIQRVPNLVSYLQTCVDEAAWQKKTVRYILTGSQQFEVSHSVSQSLAGRTALLKLLPLSIEELTPANRLPYLDGLLLSGFYPRIYHTDVEPSQLLGDYLETYIERDIRQLSELRDLATFEKFVRLCAGRVGQILNMNSLAGDAGVSHTTAKIWLSLLEASYVVFLLRPWFGNVSKRLIKSPKLYFYDVGLASYLLGIQTSQQMSRDPLRGSLFENMVVIEALKYRFNRGERSNLCYYRDSRGHEVDLLVDVAGQLFPVEIKSGATFVSDHFAGIDRLHAVLGAAAVAGGALVYGGTDSFRFKSYSVASFCGVSPLMGAISIGDAG